MRALWPIRLLMPSPLRLLPAGALFAAALYASGPLARAQSAAAESMPAASSAPVVLDRVVAVVNRHPILASDVDEEIRLSILDQNQAGQTPLTPQRALQQLISRALIEQQIRQEDAEAAEPGPKEVAARVSELRSELPACVRLNCATDAGWSRFLAEHGLTDRRVEAYIRYRMEILGFIEQRFRSGIRISEPEIEAYYKNTLLPQYAAGEPAPALKEVAPRIEEILLEQQVNVLFDQWLESLRQQGEVEILDPALQPAAAPEAAEKKP
jgi:peptidyl-prolyl cis-trans isomerase SurA